MTLRTVRQVDYQLNPWHNTAGFYQPQKGWVKTIRKLLGMTTTQLAKRLGVSPRRVIALELAEKNDAVTLRTMRECATALNCTFVYALIPNISLEEMLKQQATKVASRILQQVSHSMSLEDQAVNKKETHAQLTDMVNELLMGNLKHLWEDNDV
ncbi:MAG: mobile mystery protein A [Gammaproteobacteria bacterium]